MNSRKYPVEKKQYQCSECDTRFKLKKKLNGHFSLVHKEKECFVESVHEKKFRPFQCLYCELNYPRKSDLTKHISKVHKDLIQDSAVESVMSVKRHFP